MAKLALQTLTLLFILALTGAKHTHPLDLPDDDSASIHDPSITLSEPEMKKTILLPSEKPESEPATLVELEQNETTPVDTEEEEVEERDEDRGMMFVLRHHPHRHPHLHHQISFRQFDVERPEPEETERSYGNDMLVADPELYKGVKQREGSLENDMLVVDTVVDEGFEQREGSLENDMLLADPEMEKGFGEGAWEQDLTEIHVADVGGRRHAPSQWVGLHFGAWPRSRVDQDHEHGPHRHHHHHHHNHDEEEEHRPDDEDRRDNHHHHHHDDHDKEEEHRHEHRPDDEDRRDHHHHDEDGPRKRPFGLGRREENGGGLVKRFRKFLHNIDF